MKSLTSYLILQALFWQERKPSPGPGKYLLQELFKTPKHLFFVIAPFQNKELLHDDCPQSAEHTAELF